MDKYTLQILVENILVYSEPIHKEALMDYIKNGPEGEVIEDLKKFIEEREEEEEEE